MKKGLKIKRFFLYRTYRTKKMIKNNDFLSIEEKNIDFIL